MPVLLGKVKFAKSQYYDDFGKRKRYLQKGMPARPSSSFRRNNPHPKADFLLPKTLKEDGDDSQIQVRVEQASRRYLDSLGYRQTDPPAKVLHKVLLASQKIPPSLPVQKATLSEPAMTNPSHADATSQFIQESLKLLEDSRKGDRGQMKRERGNSYKETAKDYAVSSQPQRPSKPKPSSSSQRRSSKLINSSGTDLVQSIKRSHPTTPPGSATASPRPRSVSYEAQRSAQKKGSQISETPSKDDGKITEQLEDSTNDKNTAKVGIQESRPQTVANYSDYSPRLQQWIQGANEYEKEVALNLFNSLRSSNVKLRKTSMSPSATGIYLPGGIAGRNTREDQVVQQMMKTLQDDVDRQKSMPNLYESSKYIEGRPTFRQIRRAPSFDGYMHVGSQFRPTRPPFRKCFDIAPDWCSEGKTYRRLVKRASQRQVHQSV
ncbi:hypothetical protein HOLleu_29491 [Holothuria leucospilota]|uniref:Uncharacterized protein n=1 Tax=Holothuria leucospilota TaxID=206669 RepID=A0A9Q1H1R7_HOLLE|nr:hypothetical protein HOLleu_29491 [Holothuria leucospilota]